MYKPNTVFIVGAGASKELGFPLGAELRDNISALLVTERNHRAYGPLMKPKDIDFYRYATGTTNVTDEELHVWEQIREGIHFAPSIDNYIRMRRGHEKIIETSKCAVCRIIADYEKLLINENGRVRRTLWLDSSRPQNSTEQVDRKFNPNIRWVTQLSEQLFSGVELDQLPAALERIRFICFNYDRCIEFFIGNAISSLYALPLPQAQAYVKRDLVIHPYGALGPPDQFGKVPERTDALKQIKTFNEAVTSESITETLKWGSQIVFLGFGYLPQNMSLLKCQTKPDTRILGTSLGLSDTSMEVATTNLRRGLGVRGKRSIVLKRLRCAELLAEEGVGLVDVEPMIGD